MDRIKNNVIWFFLSLYVVFACLMILFFDGTGDTGDSVLHYLYARSAPIHPELYFDHWGKPVFTLLASPFAQFGFVGIKVFNSIVILITLYLTYKSVVALELKRPIIALLIIMCSPLVILLTFSGLTEPLFALFTIWGLHLVTKNRVLLACIVISFLPFVRSEGLIIISAFGLYLLVKRHWKLLPWLLCGHVAYAVAGVFYYEDILWVFTKIPYASTTSIYGNGELFHFVGQLPYVIGIPSAILLVVGLQVLLLQLVQKKFSSEIHAIVFYGFLSYFVAHTLFWYLGIFNSMGLKRVLIGVIPFIAIIGLIGAKTIIDVFQKTKHGSLIATVVIVSLVVIFPFTKNPAAVHWDRDMKLSDDQKAAYKMCVLVEEYRSNTSKQGRLIYLPPYLSLALDIDHFDESEHININTELVQKYLRKGDIIIWDSWFSVVDAGVDREMLDNHPNLQLIKTTTGMIKDVEIEYAMYVFE